MKMFQAKEQKRNYSDKACVIGQDALSIIEIEIPMCLARRT
jgi:hypothetical protein